MRHYDAIEEGLGYMPSRYLCDVLDDMRKQFETRNFSGTLGSIEQVQAMAYRMEAALSDKRTIDEYSDEAAKLGRDLKTKRKEIKKLTKQIDVATAHKKKLAETIKKYRHIAKKETKGGTQLPLEMKDNCTRCGAPFIACACNG